jgi:uncharacterized Fe-S center protein
MASELLFARYAPVDMEPKHSIGAKWDRLLERLDIGAAVRDRRTAIKVHLGGGVGFTTVHPYFVRRLVAAVKRAGAREVFVTDGWSAVAGAADRGYTAEVLGCPIVAATGTDDRHVSVRPVDPPFRSFDAVELAGEILGAQALIDLSHVKGHGVCGFGGAVKNIAMGCVNQRTRQATHALEGGLEWDRERCTHCRTCLENCPNGAISFRDDGAFSVFYHDCKLCQHCVLACPEGALAMVGGAFRDFQHGMALTTEAVLREFDPSALLFINILMNVTIFCDCWGLSTPSLVPDVGILAGRDIVAIEQASLELIRTECLIPGSLPPGWELGPSGHLFERIHRKDPFVVVGELESMGRGSRDYRLAEVE